MSKTAIPIPDLPAELRQLLAQIPPGRVTTFGTLADALGNRIAARWVGQYLAGHSHESGCACHRVVSADGQIGGSIAGGTAAKVRLLADERIEIQGGRVDLARFGWKDFVGPRPLEQLRKVQEEVVRHVVLRPRQRMPKRVGGVDVSYAGPEEGVAAFTLVDTQSGELVWSTTYRGRVAFPYIPTYLTFREMPLLLDLLDAVRTAGRLPEVVLVDGTGVLHHRHAGIATHLGVAASLPTIGVTKKLLCGQVDLEGMKPRESRPVAYQDRIVGAAIRPTAGSLRPIFLSPGHRTDLAFAERLVRQVLLGRRLPEPLYWADRLSRAAARGESA